MLSLLCKRSMGVRFHTGVTQCFVPTEYCYKLGRRLGLQPDQLILHGMIFETEPISLLSHTFVTGLPIRPEFGKPLPSKSTLRKKLVTVVLFGMDDDNGCMCVQDMLDDVPAVLLVGGGEGMGSLEKTVLAIEKSIGALVQVVVICGRNQALARRLSERSYPPGMHVEKCLPHTAAL